MRKSVKKNTWIFVADTSMNLYVGIKQSGSFQHSSFLHGTRISAAGLIKIKRGQLRSLSPLSGHYRPPATAFRHFISHLKDERVDMSRVSISKSYAVLVGLETYMGGKKKVHAVGDGIKDGIERVVRPEEARKKRENEKDHSQSARIEEEKVREVEEQKGIGKMVRDVRSKVLGEGEGAGGSRPGSRSMAAKVMGKGNGGGETTVEESQMPLERDRQANSVTTPAVVDSSKEQTPGVDSRSQEPPQPPTPMTPISDPRTHPSRPPIHDSLP